MLCSIAAFKILTQSLAFESNARFKFDDESDIEVQPASYLPNFGLIFGQQGDEIIKNRISIRHKKYPKLDKIICENLGCVDSTLGSNFREHISAPGKYSENSIITDQLKSKKKAQKLPHQIDLADIVQRHKKEVNNSKSPDENVGSQTRDVNSSKMPQPGSTSKSQEACNLKVPEKNLTSQSQVRKFDVPISFLFS